MLTFEQIEKLADKAIDNVRSKNMVGDSYKNIASGFNIVREKLNEYGEKHDVRDCFNAWHYQDFFILEQRLEAIEKETRQLIYDINHYLQNELLDKELEDFKNILKAEEES